MVTAIKRMRLFSSKLLDNYFPYGLRIWSNVSLLCKVKILLSKIIFTNIFIVRQCILECSNKDLAQNYKIFHLQVNFYKGICSICKSTYFDRLLYLRCKTVHKKIKDYVIIRKLDVARDIYHQKMLNQSRGGIIIIR